MWSPVMFVCVMLLDGIVVRSAAESRCDPLTQYEVAGQCCKKCGPGTRMQSASSCLDPQCVACNNHEYQDTYTTSDQCVRQPYCDPNKNQQVPTPESTRKRSSCVCLTGFHCSSQSCTACEPHTVCPPGEFANSTGNHSHDTVCAKCPAGSFSSSSSWNSVCTKWTDCGSESLLKASGTHVSDNICEESSRTHYVLILVLLGVATLACIVLFLCREKAKQRTKECWGRCHTDLEKVPAEPARHTNTYVDVPDPVLYLKPEQDEPRTPEENQEEPLGEGCLPTALLGLSDNGQVVLQEKGKDEVQPQQETDNTLSTELHLI